FKSDTAHFETTTHPSGYDSWYSIQRGLQDGWEIHEAETHTPKMFYVPYALTEDPYFLEALQYHVQWSIGFNAYHRDVTFRSMGTRICAPYPGETRSIG